MKADEDYYDPGGYFVINGTEKTILMVEQTSANRIIIVEHDDVLKADVTSSTHERKTRCSVTIKNKKFYLEHAKSFGKVGINVAVVFKAMGITQD